MYEGHKIQYLHQTNNTYYFGIIQNTRIVPNNRLIHNATLIANISPDPNKNITNQSTIEVYWDTNKASWITC